MRPLRHRCGTGRNAAAATTDTGNKTFKQMIMKKSKNLLTCLFLFIAAVAHADNDRPIQASRLPEPAQRFIERHFPDRTIALAKEETEFLQKSYEVIFTDGCQVEFDGKGDWKQVECKSSAVPAAVIPAPILEYVKTHHPDASVVKIEKERREYEAKLSDRVELTFDSKFNLIDIDY